MTSIKILLNIDEAKKLRKNLKSYDKSKLNSLCDLLKISKIDGVKNYYHKPEKNVSMETCFNVYKLVKHFKMKPVPDVFFDVGKCSIDDILLNLWLIQRSIQNEEDDQLFNEFMESGDLIQIFSMEITDCFKSAYFDKFQIALIIKIIEKRIELGKFIPSPDLYFFISKKIKERFVLLRYLNFNYLNQKSIVPILEFKQYVIQFIQQYDECLHNVISLNNDKEKVFNSMNNLCKNGNQIAALYLTSKNGLNFSKSGDANSNFSKSGDANSNFSKSSKKVNQNKEVSTKRDDFSKTTTNNKNRLNLIQDDDDDDDDIKPTQNKKSGNKVISDSKTSKKSERKSDNTNDFYRTKKSDKAKDLLTTKKNQSNLPNSRTNKNKNYSEYDDYEEDEEESNDERQISKTLPPRISNNRKVSSAGNLPKNKTFKTGRYNRPITAEDKERISIWKETESIIQKGSYKDDIEHKTYKIKEDIEYTNENTSVVSPTHKFKNVIEPRKITENEKQEIFDRVKVINKSTFEAARKYCKNDKNDVCVLNFASATQPGGGVKNGRGAQEETLSRMSSLYYSLIVDDRMYKYHQKQNDPFYSDFMIFSPDVVVFRDDDYNLIKCYHVSVISSAAVNSSEVKQVYGNSSKIENKIYNTMKNRCRKILLLCLENDIHIIILGAFGCGVFKNKPEDISKIFRELIVDEGYGLLFDRIVFAIKSPPNSPNYTLKQFKKAFNVE